MSQVFRRTIESFACGHCGLQVVGNGYTNHCPSCLWSKHVDVHPGDRASTCGGLMKPIGLIIRGEEKILTHRCIVCGYEKNNAASGNDNTEALIALSTKPS